MSRKRRQDDEPGEGGEFLHQSVAEALRRRIVEGRLAGGAKLPALRELAEEFGVSTMAVRQALGVLEREGQVYRIAGVGAFVSPPPGGASASLTMLAFAASDLINAFEMGIARGVEKACQRRGWTVQVFDAGHDVAIETSNLLRLSQTGAKGAIIVPTWGDPQFVDTLFEVHQSGFPMVMADRIPPGLTADLVESDHEAGAYRATMYLLQHGYSHVLMLTPPPGVSSIAARIRGYERALRHAGKTPLPEWKVWLDLEVQAKAFQMNKRWLGGYEAVLPVLRQSEPPLAIFAVDPYTAWGVYEACHQLGLRIPNDVSIVGFDDSEIALAMRPAITIIRQRTEELGQVAVELLERRLQADNPEGGSGGVFTHAVVDVDLIERESVATVSSD